MNRYRNYKNKSLIFPLERTVLLLKISRTNSRQQVFEISFKSHSTGYEEELEDANSHP